MQSRPRTNPAAAVPCGAPGVPETEHIPLLLAAGAVIDDVGTGGHGGILLVDTDDRTEAERFAAEDPFTKAGLFEKVAISRWRKAFFNGKRLI